MEKFNLPSKVRRIIYIANGVLSPVMIYLLATGIIGDLEMALYTAEIAFVCGLASINTDTSTNV